MEENPFEKQVTDERKNFDEEAFSNDFMYEGDERDMKNVTDWVRRSVLFWNQNDKHQDSSSNGGGSDEALDEVASLSDNVPDTRSDSQSDNLPDTKPDTLSDRQTNNPSDFQAECAENEQENVLNSNEMGKGEVLPDSSPFQTLNDSPTEPTKIFDTDQRSSANDMINDVESIQKLLIDPFIMESEQDKENSFESFDNSSPYYTLNFPKYTEHVYSPLYEEHVRFRTEKVNPELNERNDWNIAEKLNRLSQTRGQLMSNYYNTGKSDIEANDFTNYGDEMDCKRIDSDIFKAIKKVQDTLGEIADELETTRTRKTSKERDPNLILINLLSRIQPPVNRDSYTYSPTQDASQSCQQLIEMPESSVREEAGMSNACQEDETATKKTTDKGCEEEEFDVFKELSDPQKSTEDVLQEFMQKLSSTSKPSSAIRGLLKRISEEITSDNSFEQSLYQSNDALDSKTREVTSPIKNPSCQIIVEHESGTECDNMHEHEHADDKKNDMGSVQGDRRISSLSGNSSLPTSPSATNYDSGFSELNKSINYTRKESLASFLPDESTRLNMERRLKEAFEKTRSGFDSETSTDWSPCSTLSNSDLAFKKAAAGLKHSPFQRVTPRRRSTGMTSSKSALKFQPGNTNSCPNFDRGNLNSLQDHLKRYTRAEVEAIRKFLSLTSLHFGCRGSAPSEPQNDNYEELMQRGDMEVIHGLLKHQREDLERQRRKQDELYNRLGDMLLQLVTLKEEHMVSTQKQTKALTLLKKQLDIQKKDQQRAQEAIKERVNTLGEQISSSGVEHSRNHSPALSIPNSIGEKHTGQIIWKITGITRKVTRIHAGSSDDVTISDPFYSGPYGYKMAAWVYLNGRADFRGKGISVYVCPLCGEYDAILPWPVKPVYTFTLIDQNPDATKKRNHVKVRNIVQISKKGDTALSSKGGIPRPQQGKKSFIIGFDDFISQSELASSKYIFEDTMFLNVKAEIN